MEADFGVERAADDEVWEIPRRPHERIVVFDEAQRAWDADRTAEYLTDDSGAWIGYSEPAMLLSILIVNMGCSRRVGMGRVKRSTGGRRVLQSGSRLVW